MKWERFDKEIGTLAEARSSETLSMPQAKDLDTRYFDRS